MHSRTKSIWDKIFKETLLFQSFKNNLQNLIDVEKTANFYLATQNENGYFYLKSPMLQSSYPFIGILNSIKRRPSLNTIRFIKDCQIGMEFAEMPGETPWWFWTDEALEIFNWFKITLTQKNKMIKFYKKFQNSDGGFGSIRDEKSNVDTTFMMINILSKLGSCPKDTYKAMKWIKLHFTPLNYYLIYNYVNSLLNLDYKFNLIEKQKLYTLVTNFLNTYNIQDLYFCLKTLKLLNCDISKFKYLLKELRWKFIFSNKNPYDTFYISQIFFMFNLYDRLIARDLHNYVKSYELKSGGFFEKEPSLMKNTFTYLSLFILDSHTRVNSNFFIWLENAVKKISWDRIFIDLPYVLLIYKLLDVEFIASTELFKILNKEIKAILNNDLGNYRKLRHIKGILEIWMLTDYDAKSYLLKKIAENILKFYNTDGGFGHPKLSYMYATNWAITSLFIIHNFLDYKNVPHKNWIVKLRTHKWIKSCQNSDGGFGSMPFQPSTLQTTFLAVESLFLLKKFRDTNINKIIRYILKYKTSNGIFNHDLLYSFYELKSLFLLGQIKNSQSMKLDRSV